MDAIEEIPQCVMKTNISCGFLTKQGYSWQFPNLEVSMTRSTLKIYIYSAIMPHGGYTLHILYYGYSSMPYPACIIIATCVLVLLIVGCFKFIVAEHVIAGRRLNDRVYIYQEIIYYSVD